MDINTLKKIEHRWNTFKTRFICEKVDKSDIPEGKNELRLFVKARNESLRLPYFLNYYFNNGVDRIFLIDNDSEDNTREIALGFSNVHVFKITKPYRNHWYWIEYFLEKYGKNRWCMVVDVDEFFSYPFSEIAPLKTLINYLEVKKYDAIRSVLLDIYSDKPIIETGYAANENPLKYCPYFDSHFFTSKGESFDRKKWEHFETINYLGGMRNRMFNKRNGTFCLSKISLLKYSDDVYLARGMHAINGAEIADITGVVFHAKYLQDFVERVKIEAKREEYYKNAMEYKIYDEVCSAEKDICLYYKDSVKFKNTKQLVKLGMMKNSFEYSNYLATQDLNFDNHDGKYSY